MPRRSKTDPPQDVTPPKPATTPEGREQQIASAAYDLAERQIMAGTASSQVITHFLKAGETRNRLEMERIKMDIALAQAKVEQIASQARQEEMFSKVIDAMRAYSGQAPLEMPDDFDD